MVEPTVAEILLTAAERDRQGFAKLAEDTTLHDSLCGFHAQTVEKALRAVLAHAGVVFRRTDNIAELVDLPGPFQKESRHSNNHPYVVVKRVEDYQC